VRRVQLRLHRGAVGDPGGLPLVQQVHQSQSGTHPVGRRVPEAAQPDQGLRGHGGARDSHRLAHGSEDGSAHGASRQHRQRCERVRCICGHVQVQCRGREGDTGGGGLVQLRGAHAVRRRVLRRAVHGVRQLHRGAQQCGQCRGGRGQGRLRRGADEHAPGDGGAGQPQVRQCLLACAVGAPVEVRRCGQRLAGRQRRPARQLGCGVLCPARRGQRCGGGDVRRQHLPRRGRQEVPTAVLGAQGGVQRRDAGAVARRVHGAVQRVPQGAASLAGRAAVGVRQAARQSPRSRLAGLQRRLRRFRGGWRRRHRLLRPAALAHGRGVPQRRAAAHVRRCVLHGSRGQRHGAQVPARQQAAAGGRRVACLAQQLVQLLRQPSVPQVQLPQLAQHVVVLRQQAGAQRAGGGEPHFCARGGVRAFFGQVPPQAAGAARSVHRAPRQVHWACGGERQQVAAVQHPVGAGLAAGQRSASGVCGRGGLQAQRRRAAVLRAACRHRGRPPPTPTACTPGRRRHSHLSPAPFATHAARRDTRLAPPARQPGARPQRLCPGTLQPQLLHYGRVGGLCPASSRRRQAPCFHSAAPRRARSPYQ